MKTLRIGLAGAGHIAASHLAAWQRTTGCRLRGIFDVDRQAAEARALQFAGPCVYDDFGALINDCDVVDLCTPPHTHAELAHQVLAAGRHLLSEKPIVTRLDEWRELSRLLEGSTVRLAVVHNLKYVRSVRRARRWLEQGRIGRLIRLSRIFLTDPANDRMLAGHHWSHALPGGRWFETLPHALYLIHDFLGALEPASVVALRTASAPPGVPADEVTVVFRGTAGIADIHYSANCCLNRRHLTLWGTLGRIEIDLLADSVTISNQRDSRWLRAIGDLPAAAAQAARWPADRAGYLAGRLRGQTPHTRLIADFARHLQGQGPSPTPPGEIDYVVRTAHAISREIERQAESSPDGQS